MDRGDNIFGGNSVRTHVDSLSASVESAKEANNVCIELAGNYNPKFPEEKQKTFVAMIILIFSFITNSMSLAMVHERVPENDRSEPLPDIVLDSISGHHQWALDASEIIIMISTNILFMVAILHKHRFIVLRRVFLILSLLYLMRSLTMYATVLPKPDPSYYCSPKANTTSFLLIAKRAAQLISGFGLVINGKHTYCGDYMYSGHTVMLVISYLVIKEYAPRKMAGLHWVSCTASSVGVFLVLLARGHYTIDILAAYYVTTITFWIYHTMANHEALKTSSAHNHLSRVWWFRIFQYFEGNIGGVVPRQFDWPFPWPQCLLTSRR